MTTFVDDLEEIEADCFAGGGGVSLGLQWANGRSPAIAINHDRDAIAMHAANHPDAHHFTEDVWKVNPRRATCGRAVGLLWLSPDCKHFSRAKGGKPAEKGIRSLAWVAIRWAIECKPRIIMLENVREFADWGPLTDDNRPCPLRKGLTFRRFVGRLRGLGYTVEWRVLNAADYGAPTHRRRLFLIARCDGEPIVWPEPTHGDPKRIGTGLFDQDLQPWRTAAECIDWNIPCPSIFDRKRPLAEKTMRRIALGIKRYVLDNRQPFIVCCNHGGEEFRGSSIGDPFPTLTASRDAHGLVIPVVVQFAHGEGKVANGTWGEGRSKPINAPLGTIHSGGGNHGLVAAFLTKHFGGVVGVPVSTPLPTVTMRGTQTQLTVANLVHFNYVEKQWSDIRDPMRTITTGNHAALVYSFLCKYFGTAIGQPLDRPMGTQTSRDRYALVTVWVDGELYVIVDIGMRMLRPRELARANALPD
ncbi:MAG TPA: DNA cytosine methyltransferase, partial [Thermoanaerobaculia bacterium]|nr:DNA cytosine methyltransferase [Thermoanaerobaculia bacterium]